MEPELTVTDEAAARALAQNHSLLGRFLTPQSPSEVAARLGMAANLLHHHARKLQGLGLLREDRREGGRVYYVLTARRFRVPTALLPPGDPDENAVRTLRELSTEFLQANARSWGYGSRDEGAVYGFGPAEDEPEIFAQPRTGSDEPHPTHLDALTLRLTPERYRRLALAISGLLNEACRQGQREKGEVCTLAVLGFRTTQTGMQDGHGTRRSTSSFLPLQQ